MPSCKPASRNPLRLPHSAATVHLVGKDQVDIFGERLRVDEWSGRMTDDPRGRLRCGFVATG